METLIDSSVEAPSLEFDARLDAQWRSYTYVIYFSRQPCVFLAAYTYRIYDVPVEALDLQVMQQVIVFGTECLAHDSIRLLPNFICLLPLLLLLK